MRFPRDPEPEPRDPPGMDLLSSLNTEQRAAVEHVDGALLILAGAGSGKTRVIAHRVAWLVQQGHAALDQVLAVTFTNKAAEEMRTRVEGLLQRDCRAMWISTFHSLCARLLRREAHHLGLSRSFTIYDSADQQAVVKQLVKEYRLDDTTYQPRMVLGRISHAKNRMEGPETFADTWNPRDREIGRLYAGYQQALAAASAVDFDDLLLKSVELFDKVPAVRQRYARRFKFAMIDEYQDTNRPQYLLVKQLVSVHGNLCVVGDPDQSIYKWRGADVKNILDFERDFPDAVTVKLERNYRSTQVILDAASAVVRRNRGRKDRALWTDQAGGAPIVTYRGADELDEADFIVKVVRRRARCRFLHDDGHPLSHQRPVAGGGRRAAPGRHSLRGARRHGLLRAQGNQGRAGLSEAGAQPARRRGFAARHQHPAARHRQGRDGRARAARHLGAPMTHWPPLLAGLDLVEASHTAVGEARFSGRRAARCRHGSSRRWRPFATC